MAILSKSDLNEDQKAALKYIVAFLGGPNRQMVLSGPAGTGKTSLINVLLDELDADELYKYICTAPTNKAVDVIAKSTARDFKRTIYSLLGLTLVEEDDGPPKLVRQEGSKSSFDEYDLIIIDEASMVSTQLVAYIQKEMQLHCHTKIIYVGDPCQIPPVDDANMGVMRSIVFDLPLCASLTKVMRTAEENPILGIVTKMRDNMASPTDLFAHTSAQGNDGIGVYFENKEKPFMTTLIDYFTRPEYKEDTNYAMAVAYTNEAVNAINDAVRKALYPDDDEYVVGEELRVTRPYGTQSKWGGLGIIYTGEQRIKVLSCKKLEDPVYKIPCYFMKVNAIDGNSLSVHSCYVVAKDGMAKYLEVRASLVAEAKERAERVGKNNKKIFTKKDAWKFYMSFKSYFLFVGYVYALTAHKSQGTTVTNVFVVERNINRIQDPVLRNKLKYTAFTRAAKELHVLT